MTATEKDRDILARTLWGEARGEGTAGQIAVAWAIKNRVNETLPDANAREQLCLIPLCALVLIMGVASPLWMRQIDPSVIASIAGVTKTTAQTNYKSAEQRTELHRDSAKR